ncbi:TelA-like protein [Clostridiales bacterium CHKCI006]|nr:TelA-like protein [Clostridiales bacterium CHKCI006]
MEQKAEQTISLTLNPFAEEKANQVDTKAIEKEEIVTEQQLTDEEKKMVDDFVKQIDLNNSELVLQYGAAAQTKMANFSETTLNSVRTKDLGEVGQLMTDLINELKSIDTEEEKGGFSFFRKAKDKVSNLKTKYEKAETNVDHITEVLEGHQIQLMKDIALLDEMYEMNLNHFKELSLYIIAGQKRLKQAREVELSELINKAQRSGLPEDSQAANDYASLCDRFEKKLHDLELTRMVALQMGPQIRLIQNNNIQMTEKIQSSIVNTIPLWKSQMVLALGLDHSTKAMEAQRAVSDMTNQLLKKNAEKLKMGTLETAKESERGIVDMETLKQTNQSLISTLDEVMKIQQEGRAKRQAASEELAKIENELKNKLLEIRH